MAGVHVACPSGLLLPLTARYEEETGLLTCDHGSGQLLERLQVFINRTERLLALISVQRQEAVRNYKREISDLYGDAATCLQQCLVQVACAKQPLLLTSAQHTSCFCRLLERLHLVEVLVTLLTEDPDASDRVGLQAGPVLEGSTSFIHHLEQQLQTLPGIDAVLASFIQHCQMVAAAGSKLDADLSSIQSDNKGKGEVIEVAALASIHEQHSALRALPLLLRLYYSNCSRAETLAAGKPEALSSKLLEKCFAQLAAKPVVPGHADMPLCLPSGLEFCQGLVEAAAARKLKLPTGLPADAKTLLRLDQSYNMRQKVLPLLQQHDMLCDLLSQLALEVRQSMAVDRDIDSKAFNNAEHLVVGCIEYVTAAKNVLLELDAWRLTQKQQQQTEQSQSAVATSCQRFALTEEDITPFTDVLGAMKGITGLAIDSENWLQQLLFVNIVKQLQEFAMNTLPALAKLYLRNERIQELTKAAIFSMQGQVLELKDDVCTSSATSAVASVPVTPTAENIQIVEHPFRTAPGPVAEGLENLKAGWGRIVQHVQPGSEQQRGASEQQPGTEQVIPEAGSATANAVASAAVALVPSLSQQDAYDSVEQQLETGEQWAAASSAGAAVTEHRGLAAVGEQQQSGSGKKLWGRRLMKSMRSGRSKPQPSPHPELCAPPAALAALEEMLSGAEAEYQHQEAEAADGNDPAVLGVRLQLSGCHDGLERTSMHHSYPETINSMTGTPGATITAYYHDDVPGSVAAAAAVFERLAACHRSEGSSIPPHNTPTATTIAAASEALGATTVPVADLPASPRVLDPQELATAADQSVEEDEGASRARTADGAADPASRFQLFKFKSILSHHQRLSSIGTSEQLATADPDNGKMHDEESVEVQQGAASRMRSMLSIRRRQSASELTSAVSSELRQAGDAADVTGSVLPADRAASGVLKSDIADISTSRMGTADADQPTKQSRVAGIVSRMISLRLQGKEAVPAAGDGATISKGFKALNLTAKLKKAMGERRQAEAADVDDPQSLQIDSPPPLVCLVQLRVILEQLMHEIKTETKKHLMMQLQMAAAAAAGSAGAKPDASIARPLKQVKTMIKAVYRMQLSLDYVSQLRRASDLSALWISKGQSCVWLDDKQQQQSEVMGAAPAASCRAADIGPAGGTSRVMHNALFEEYSQSSRDCRSSGEDITEGQEAKQQCETPAAAAQGLIGNCNHSASSFPAALIAGCMKQLQRMPAELPLLAVHILWDARFMLQSHGLLEWGLKPLKQQEEACMRCYMSGLVPQAYEHFKRVAGYHTISQEALQTWDAVDLLPVQSLYLDVLLRETCPIMLQGDYTAVAAAAESVLSRPGAVLARGSGNDADMSQQPELDHLATEQQLVFSKAQVALQELLQQQHSYEPQEMASKTTEHAEVDQQTDKHCLHSASAPKHVHNCSQPNISPSREAKHRKRRKAAHRAAAIVEGPAAVASTQPVLLTPLMQKVEQQQLAQQAEITRQDQQVQQLAASQGACLVDVRDWLLAGLVTLLRKDCRAVVDICRHNDPTVVVEAHLRHSILQHTHELISQYTPLPCSWQQLWSEADAMTSDSHSSDVCQSTSVHAIADGLLQLMNTAVYDSEAQVFFAAAAGGISGDGVLSWLSAALKPFKRFFGRQHLQSLLVWAGAGGQQHVLSRLLAKMEADQAALLDQLRKLQDTLPPALQQLPPAQQCHNAASILQFYQTQLSQAVADPATCSSALSSLQRIGNCVALLHLLSKQQAVQATSVFMQAAPMLGIVGRPIQDAAAAAECFELEGLPPPPSCEAAALAGMRSCAPGLFMPQIEQLEPTDSAQQAYEMQVQRELLQELAWQEEAEANGEAFDTSLLKPGGDLARHRVWEPSYFQQLLLGHDAAKVRGPALLLTQAAELRLWRAAQTQDYMGPCMERIQCWVRRLQQQLQGCDADPTEACQDTTASSTVLDSDHHSRCDTAMSSGDSLKTRVQAAGRLAQQLVPHQESQQVQRMQQVDLRDLHITETGPNNHRELTTVAADIAGIGVRDNSLYQQQYASSPEKEMQQGVESLEEAQEEEEQLQAEPVAPAAIVIKPYSTERSSTPVLQHAACSKGASDADLPIRPVVPVESSSPLLVVDGVADTSIAAVGTLRLRDKLPSQLTQEDLEAAAEAAVLAASQPGSPQCGAVANPWEAAGAAAALLPAGAIAPAHVKLAYRALFDSSNQQQGGEEPADSGADEPLGSGGASGRFGLAELVSEASGARTGRSDTIEPVQGQTVSSRQAQLQWDAQTANNDVCNKLHSAEGTDRSTLATSFSKEPTDGSAADAAAASTPGASPSRLVMVPKLGLSGMSPAHVASQPVRELFDASTDVSSVPLDADSLADDAEEVLPAGRAVTSSDTAASNCDSVEPLLEVDGTNRRSSYPEDELLDGTCAELMRVKMERDTYKSEVEVLKNQLRNQDQTIALLSGNFHTPRTTDAGQSGCGSPDREGSSLQRAGSPNPGLPSSNCAQPEAKSGSGALLAADGNAAAGRSRLAEGKEEVPSVSSEQLSAEQSDLRPEASKLSTRVQQPSLVERASDMHGVDDQDENSDNSADSDSDDSSTMSRPAIRKLQLPQPVHDRLGTNTGMSSGINSAQLAVALSALKFALLLDVAMGPSTSTGLDDAATKTRSAAGIAPDAMLHSSQLKRLKKVSVAKATAGTWAVAPEDSTAAELPIRTGDIETAAEEAVEPSGDSHSSAVGLLSAGSAAKPSTAASRQDGNWHTAGGQYGDGPLLASAVLLQLSGQVRKHALLDVTNRIAHWVEYDAVKQLGGLGRNNAEGKAVVAAPAAAGGINPSSADGIAPPKPSSKKRMEEEAEQEARQKQEAAAQQALLQKLAAAARQADKVSQDGSSIAARFAPPVPSHRQKVKLQVFRPDVSSLLASKAAADTSGAEARGPCAAPGTATEATKRFVRFSTGNSRDQSSSTVYAGSALRDGTVHAVPVQGQILEFQPAVQPWSDLTPCSKPIQEHPLLPMPRPKPLLLPNGLPSVAAQPNVAAAAGCALPNSAGQLVAGPGVTPGAGLVAAARAVHAREALLATMPRAAMYSFSVKSDHNRSGRPDDGYSKAPSSIGWDSMEENSPRKQKSLAAAAAAVGAGAVRLGGRRPGGTADGQAAGEGKTEYLPQGAYSGSEASSPNKSPTRSPTRRAASAISQLLTQQTIG